MSDLKHYFLNKLKHQNFPHLAFDSIAEFDQQQEDFFRALHREMKHPDNQTVFQKKYPFEFLTSDEMDQLEDDEYRRYLRYFKQERVEEMMYLDDQLYQRNTLDHLLGVHYIAMKTARHLKQLGIPVDLGRVSGSASGHDIGKYGVLPQDVARIAYYHYFYSDQWYRMRRLENIGNVAVNHSTWDLELNSLSIESLILIYSDFQVKNNAAGEMQLFSLKDSFDVILNKLDNLDEAKTVRYQRVYQKLVDFESYVQAMTNGSEPEVALFDQAELLAEYKYEGIDESIYTMHELRSPASIKSLLENSFDQPTVTLSLVILQLLKDYHLYLTASQKDIVLEYLYRLILHSDELIRLQSSELIGQVLKHYDIVYRKERPASAPPNPIHRQKLRRIKQLDRFFEHRDQTLIEEKRHWLSEGYHRARSQFEDTVEIPEDRHQCLDDDKTVSERYLENLKTAVPVEVKICNLNYLQLHDRSFHFIMHLINLVKVSSSRTIQRFAGQMLLDMFDQFAPAEKNDVTIELLRSMELDGNHLRIELPLIVGTILQKLPALEVMEILDDVHQSIEYSKKSAPSLLDAIIQTLPHYLSLEDQTIALKICAIFSSALVNRDHSIDQVAIMRLASFYQNDLISLEMKRDMYLQTGKKFLILSREMQNDFQTRLNYSNYINAVYNFISQYENQSDWPVIPPRQRLIVSANFDPMNLMHKQQIRQYTEADYEVFVHLRETNWQYLLAPQQLRRVIAEMTIADLWHTYIWPSSQIFPTNQPVEVLVLPENDKVNDQVRQAVQHDWQTSELLSPQAERFIRTGFLYRNLAQTKKKAGIRDGFVIHNDNKKLWLRSEADRIESLEYDSQGQIFNWNISSQRGLHDIGVMLLNQALYILYRQGITQAIIDVKEKVSPRLLYAMGFERSDNHFVVSLIDPVIFVMDLPSRIVDSYRREKRLRTMIAKNRRKIMLALHELYPGRAIMAFDRGVFYNDIIKRVSGEAGDRVIVPIGSMFQHHYLPDHPTKTLHIDKLYSPEEDDIVVTAQRNHLPIDRQVETLRQLGDRAIVIDDVLHSGRRVNALAPLLAEHDFPMESLMVGIATGNGVQHAQKQQVHVAYTYFFESITQWYLESELYLFLGGLVSPNSRNDRIYSLSLNRISPFISREPAEAFERFSNICIKAAEEFMFVADKIFREKQGHPMRLSDLNHLIYDVYIPDVFFYQVDDMTIQQFFEKFHASR